LTSVSQKGSIPQIASGYACAYPLGVLGIIGATIAIRYICHISLEKEEEDLNVAEDDNPHAKPHQIHLKVQNSFIAGRTLAQISEFLNRDIVCTRILHDGKVTIPKRDTVFNLEDEVLIVCAEADADAIQAFIGPLISNSWDYEDKTQPLVSKRIIVTRSSMSGKVLGSFPRRRPPDGSRTGR